MLRKFRYLTLSDSVIEQFDLNLTIEKYRLASPPLIK
jgi:hypothetical protein